MDNDNDRPQTDSYGDIRLPAAARLPINRCDLPASILGSLTYQRHPVPLRIDGVAELHPRFFRELDRVESSEAAAHRFHDYMTVRFRLKALDDAGYDPNGAHGRPKADYRRMLRGWFFDSDSREGAVLKGWTESRFGLVTRFHRTFLPSPDADPYRRFTHEYAMGLYNTNALEAQLDLVYAFTQRRLTRENNDSREHLTLYRGVNSLHSHEILQRDGDKYVMLLNNMNSFTASRHRAEEFGDTVLRARVPLAKIFFASNLLPDMLQGEAEHIVVGGLYEVVRLQ